MKSIIAVLITMLMGISLFAQPPQKLAFKTTVKDKDGVIVTNKPITLKISLIKGSTLGDAIFSETQNLTTDAAGAIFVEVGNGNPTKGSFKDVNLEDDTYFIRTEIESLGIIKVSKVRKAPPLETTIAPVHKKLPVTQNKTSEVKTEADTTSRIYLSDSLKKVIEKKRLENESKINSTKKKDHINQPIIIHKTDSTLIKKTAEKPLKVESTTKKDTIKKTVANHKTDTTLVKKTAEKKIAEKPVKVESITKKDTIKKTVANHKTDTTLIKKTTEKKIAERPLKVENTLKKDTIKKTVANHKADSLLAKKITEKKITEKPVKVENTAKKDTIEAIATTTTDDINDNTVIIVKKRVTLPVSNVKITQTETDSLKKIAAPVPPKDTLKNILPKTAERINNLPKTDSINRTITKDSLKKTVIPVVDKKNAVNKDSVVKEKQSDVVKTTTIAIKDTLSRNNSTAKVPPIAVVDSAKTLTEAEAKKSFLGKKVKNKTPVTNEPVTVNNIPPPVLDIVEFKTVIKNINGVVFADAPVIIKINVITDSVKGKSVFEETHVGTTDADGVVKFIIGRGAPLKGVADSIHWKNKTYFIKTETKPTGVSKIDSAKNVIIINKKDNVPNKSTGFNETKKPVKATDSAIVKTNSTKKDLIDNTNWEGKKSKLQLQNEAIEDNPKDTNAYYTRGMIKNRLQDYRGAITDFNKAIELNPNHVESYTGRGIAKAQLKNYKEAIEDFNKAIALNPNFAEAYAQRGVARTQLKDTAGVLKDFNTAIKLAPDSAEYYSYRGTFKSNMEDYRGAISDYTKSIAKNPHNALTFYNRGNTEFLYKNDIGAIEDFGQAIKLDPNNPNAYYKRGNVKASLKDTRGAIADYDMSIKLDPENLKAYYNAGIMKTELKDYKGAMDYFDKIIQLDPEWSSAYFSRGVTKINLGQTNSGCLDLSKAGELGYSKAYNVIKKHCN